MTPEAQADEIYMAMLNAGAGITTAYLARKCARIYVRLIALHDSSDMADKKYWQKVLTHLQSPIKG